MNFKDQIRKFLNWLSRSAIYFAGLLGILFAICERTDFLQFDFSLEGCATFPLGNILYIILITLFICSTLLSIRRSEILKGIDKEYQSLKYQKEKIEENLGIKIRDNENYQSQSNIEKSNLFKGFLQLIFNNLDLKHTDRISVYKVHESRFIMLGRFSSNPRLEAIGRPWYPIYEGCIGHAWETGDSKLSNLPDPNTQFTDYVESSNNFFSIPTPTLEQIKMKSRTYFAKRIQGYDGSFRAIVVIESIEPTMQFDELESELLKHSELLVLLIEKITFADNGQLATETGF